MACLGIAYQSSENEKLIAQQENVLVMDTGRHY